MQTLFENWAKVLQGMVTMTACLAFLGIVFLPAFGYNLDGQTVGFVFGLITAAAASVGIGGAVARTLGVKE